MINYLGKFVPNLFKNAENLRKLLEKDTEWYFDKNHKEAIDNFKLLVISPPVLKFYNPLLPIKVSCDASEKCLGALLEQKENERWHPIAYASRALNKSEKNYCQLEKKFSQSSLLVLSFMIMSMVGLFMCTMSIFHSNQYLSSLLLNRPHAFKDIFSIYKSITLKCITCKVPY